MSKVYVIPLTSIELMRKKFKAAKADARGKTAASNVEGGKKDASEPTA